MTECSGVAETAKVSLGDIVVELQGEPLEDNITLQAFKEVEDALVAETRQREFLRLTQDQLDVARTTLEQAEQRYLQGLNDFLPVLTALQSVQRTEQTVLSARRQLISQRIQLHRALGGDWTAQLADPARPQDDEPQGDSIQ